MNSCSDIIGCLWSVKFLPVFWNWDLQSHFTCDVFVYYFLSLSLSHSVLTQEVSLSCPQSRIRSNGSSGFLLQGGVGTFHTQSPGPWAVWFCS